MMRRGALIAMAGLLALPMAAAEAAAVTVEPAAPKKSKNHLRHGMGSKPVPGGGARERARALARMAKQKAKQDEGDA